MSQYATASIEGGTITDAAREIIEAPIPKDQIKTRDGGFGKKLSYVSGSTVIGLLNKAFGYNWSFEIRDIKTIKSEAKKEKNGNITEQPSYIQVWGRLTVPINGNFIIKEQFGTKIILGGASEQEGAAKSAATDALKKCATMVGIGLELYEDDAGTQAANRANSQPRTNNQTSAQPAQVKAVPWDIGDTNRLKELKAILGINDNQQLDPFVREFMDSQKATYKDISPMNVKKFNEFLQKKAETEFKG